MAAFDFKKIEEKVRSFWDEHKIFEKSLEQRQKAKRFVFFEGPPTANGRPGIHHFIGRAFKDLFSRYKTMRGFYVLRKAGWDTHGLPVELEVEKQLGFKNKKDIEEYGIARFNHRAKESVWKYKQEWEEMTKRMAFWVDLKRPYVTYETPYIESLWAILKKIWDKSLLYLAHKVVPFCTRCGTPLSSHEVAQGYKVVKEKSIYIKFKVKSLKSESRNLSTFDFPPSTYVLAWTTTPWTLPGNVALAVGPQIEYILAEQNNEHYILAKELASKILGEDFRVVKEFAGSDLLGLEYEPLFNIKKLKSENSYKVYEAGFVSTGDGTGVVHTAVMYGEDDYDLGSRVGLPKVHTVDQQGKFVDVSEELDGKYVKAKETEDLILYHLKQNNNLLKLEDYEHDYPFCWRCETPLLYYAKNSWFIKMSALRDKLLANNKKVNWIPEHIKEGRFGQWLKEGKDWAISRERYWGTPLPIWQCVKCEHHRVIGSVDELIKYNNLSSNTYYVLRHGLTTRDELHRMIIGSRLDNDPYILTDDGKKQVEASVNRLKILEEKIDFIYTSPFKRTHETAQIAGKIFHQDFQIDVRLGEIVHSPVCEGKDHARCIHPKGRETFEHKYDDGSESWNDVRRRLMDFMRDSESKHQGKKILIVSHGDPLWLLDKMAGGLTSDEILESKGAKDNWFPNLASWKKINWRDIPRNDYGELDLHRPFIDEIHFKCDSCGASMKRIPDLVDVWFDSGAMPYAQWHWPFEDKDIFKRQFPADFIVEGIDQTRGWFYTLLAVATLLDKGAPYKNVMSLGLVLDEKGQKMSKSKGNIVLPGEVMDKVGVDTARWYFYTINSPGDSKLFSYRDLEERLKGFMTTLYNCIRFYELYAMSYKPEAIGDLNLLDAWIISRLNGLIDLVTKGLDDYDSMTASRAIERFVVDDFSNWWLRRSRKRKEAIGLLRFLLFEISKLLAPFLPYTAEDLYQRLGRQFSISNDQFSEKSVHLCDWPKVNKKSVNRKLEAEMIRVQEIVNQGLAIRKEKQIKVRQPLRSIVITGKKLDRDLEELIKEELNIKEVQYQKKGDLILDLEITADLKLEGYIREVMRQIQDMRKEAGYAFDESVYCQWYSGDAELSQAILNWSGEIKKETVLSDFVKNQQDQKVFDVQKEFEISPDKKLWLGIRK